MPVTPLHLGPGLLFKSAGRDRLSLTLFALTQITMDLEVIARIVFGSSRLHGFTNTFLGATVVLLDLNTDQEKTYQIVGIDEADLKHGKISVTSPVARALIGKIEGDEVALEAPGGVHEFEVLEVRYE